MCLGRSLLLRSDCRWKWSQCWFSRSSVIIIYHLKHRSFICNQSFHCLFLRKTTFPKKWGFYSSFFRKETTPSLLTAVYDQLFSMAYTYPAPIWNFQRQMTVKSSSVCWRVEMHCEWIWPLCLLLKLLL